MSIKLSSAVWESGAYSGTPLIVLLAMADHGKDDGSDIYPSIELVAFKARISERSAQRAVRELEADGVLICVGAASGGVGRPREYRLDIDRLMALGQPWRVKWEARLARRARRKKGDKGVTLSGNVKGDTCVTLSASKGDTGVTLCSVERVTPVAQRVTSSVEKGDTAMSPEPLEPAKENLGAGARAQGAPVPAVEPSGSLPSTDALPAGLAGCWDECRQVLGKALGQAWVTSWWERCAPYAASDAGLHLHAPSRFIADTVVGKAAGPISKALGLALHVSVPTKGLSDAG